MYHFDGDRVTAIIAGISCFEFGQGEFLTLVPRQKNFAEIAGHHGSTARARTPNQLYDGTVSILKGSPVNEQISIKMTLDATTGQGVGVLLLKDLEGTSLVSAEISYFNPLEWKASTEPIINEWPFVAEISPANWNEGANRFLVPA